MNPTKMDIFHLYFISEYISAHASTCALVFKEYNIRGLFGEK